MIKKFSFGKKIRLRLPPEDCRDILSKSIKEYNESGFPNLHILHEIGCTFSISSVEYDYVFSAIRTLITWFRASLRMDRWSTVALMDTHRQEEVNYTYAAKLFFEYYPGKTNAKHILLE